MQIIRLNEVIQKTRLSRTTIWRLYRFADFPKPIKLSERTMGFNLDEIEDWLKQRSEITQR